MFTAFYHWLLRLNRGPHIALTILGVVLVHVAAYLLFTAVAPVAGCVLALAGFALYGIGSRAVWLKPQVNRRRGVLFKA